MIDIFDTDSYKFSHAHQYPPGTQYVSSYITARGSKEYPDAEPVFFGAQRWLLALDQWRDIGQIELDQLEHFAVGHLGPDVFDRSLFNDLDDHLRNNGGLAAHIEAVPEGSVVKFGDPMLQIRMLDPKLWWLTSYLETQALRAVWYPSTVATISREIKKLLKGYLIKTGCPDPDAAVLFMLHDFGSRGASSAETAAIGGMAHLVNFMGTDTFSALREAAFVYGPEDMIAGYSVPAAEHSTITSWGVEREVDAYRNMIERFGRKDKIYSVVSDSYDFYNAVNEIWGGRLHQEVLAAGGKLVVRPDSGAPEVVAPDTVEMLAKKFGLDTESFTNGMTKTGHLMLNPKTGAIQGDGIDTHSIPVIFDTLIERGYAAQNLVLGMGGALLQKVNRDTFGFAMKCNAIGNGDFDGITWTPVQKKPKTDASKASRAGRVEGLPTVFYDGILRKHWSFEEVRNNARV